MLAILLWKKQQIIHIQILDRENIETHSYIVIHYENTPIQI